MLAHEWDEQLPKSLGADSQDAEERMPSRRADGGQSLCADSSNADTSNAHRKASAHGKSVDKRRFVTLAER